MFVFDDIERAINTTYENHLELRNNLIALVAGLEAALDQLEEAGILDLDRWQRDKIRYKQRHEQEAARKDEEGGRNVGE